MLRDTFDFDHWKEFEYPPLERPSEDLNPSLDMDFIFETPALFEDLPEPDYELLPVQMISFEDDDDDTNDYSF